MADFLSVDFNEAETYERISSIEKEDGLKLINMAAPAGGSNVLDIGCGTGFLSWKLAEAVGEKGRVVAIDPNTDRLAVAKKKYGNTKNLHFLEGSAETIPGEEQYDLVFTNHVLHWCMDLPTAFTNIARSLKPGWKFAASYVVKYGCDIDSLFSFLRPARRRHITMNVMNLVHEDECEMLVKRHGFAMIHKSIHHCVHTFEEVKDFLIFVHTHLKVEEEDIDTQVIHGQRNRDGKVSFSYPVQMVVMEKK